MPQKQGVPKLVAQQLIEQAQKATGLEHFDSDSYREGLDIFLSDVNADQRDVNSHHSSASATAALSSW